MDRIRFSGYLTRITLIQRCGLKPPSSAQRTILIGDIHGCAWELEQLLKKLEVGDDDRLVSVGDLICKGPESTAVLDWALATPRLTCVLGNHEARFVRYRNEGIENLEKPYDSSVIRQMGSSFDKYIEFIKTWPLYVDEPDFLAVHAGINPRLKSLAQQDIETLTTVRRLAGATRPWYEDYRDDKTIVFGHWARRQPIVRPNAVGLDTGCVYGGELTALILPERRLVSIQARHEYYRKAQWT